MTPRGLRVLALSVILGGTTVLLSGCSWSEVLGLGWPYGITPEAHVNRELWIGSVIASLTVGAIVWGLIFWTSAFHRRKKTETELPRQFGYNMPLELVLTVAPFLIISVQRPTNAPVFWISLTWKVLLELFAFGFGITSRLKRNSGTQKP